MLTDYDPEDNSGEDDEESHDGDDEENEERRVRFNVPSEERPRKSNGAISDEDITSESEDDSEVSQRGNRDNRNAPPSKQQSENLEPTEDMSSTLKKKREEDLEKGQAIKRQVVCPFCLHDSVCAGRPLFTGLLGLTTRYPNTTSEVCLIRKPPSAG